MNPRNVERMHDETMDLVISSLNLWCELRTLRKSSKIEEDSSSKRVQKRLFRYVRTGIDSLYSLGAFSERLSAKFTKCDRRAFDGTKQRSSLKKSCLDVVVGSVSTYRAFEQLRSLIPETLVDEMQLNYPTVLFPEHVPPLREELIERFDRAAEELMFSHFPVLDMDLMRYAHSPDPDPIIARKFVEHFSRLGNKNSDINLICDAFSFDNNNDPAEDIVPKPIPARSHALFRRLCLQCVTTVARIFIRNKKTSSSSITVEVLRVHRRLDQSEMKNVWKEVTCELCREKCVAVTSDESEPCEFLKIIVGRCLVCRDESCKDLLTKSRLCPREWHVTSKNSATKGTLSLDSDD